MSEKPEGGGSDRYEKLGVSSSKEAVHAAMKELGTKRVNAAPGAFCIVTPNGPHGMGVVAHSDGAGSKPTLGLLAVADKLEGALRYLRYPAQDALAMNLNDMVCVGTRGPYFVTNTLDRNPKIVTDDFLPHLIGGYYDTVETLREYGVNIHIGGGETADLGGPVRNLTMNASVFSELPLQNLVNCDRMVPSDVIVALSSYGQANWEKVPAGALGSNGYTSGTHDLLCSDYRRLYPWSYNDQADPELFYKGKFTLEDELPNCPGLNFAEALCRPTRIFAPLFVHLNMHGSSQRIHGIIHNSGGGVTKIKNFGRLGAATGNRYVLNSLFMEPPIFGMIRAAGFTSAEEMPQVFNLGQLMFVVLPARDAGLIINCAEASGIEAKIVGYVEERDKPGNEVIYEGNEGTFHYYQNAA